MVGLLFSDWLVEVQGGCVKELEPLAAGIPTRGVGTPAEVLGGISGIAAGLCLLVKSTVILVSGWQPAQIFELAPLLCRSQSRFSLISCLWAAFAQAPASWERLRPWQQRGCSSM
jgi:hypothetical protein